MTNPLDIGSYIKSRRKRAKGIKGLTTQALNDKDYGSIINVYKVGKSVGKVADQKTKTIKNKC